MTTETQAQTQSQAELPAHLQIKTDKVRTAGWMKFDKLVHFGISFLLNVGLALTQSVFQVNYEINKKIDAANANPNDSSLDGFRGQEKRSVWILEGYFKLAEKVKTNFTDKIFNNKYDEAGKPHSSERNFYSEVAKDVLILSNPGHITTALTQIFENKYVKPKLVRWFDKRIDEKRISRGDAPTEKELAEREAIYKKLDNELSGKSFVQIWTARFVAIATVITSLIGLGKLDQALTKADIAGEGGLFRVRQVAVGAGRFVEGGLGAFNKKVNWLSNAVVKDANTPDTYFANNMLKLFATEVVGSGITSGAQYLTLMFKEFFGKKDSAKEQAAAKTQTQAQAEPSAKPESATAGVPIAPAAKAEKDEKIADIAAQPKREEEAARVAHTEKVAPAKKPEPSEDYRDAVSKSAQMQEAALVGA